jgi:hypothetical protein
MLKAILILLLTATPVIAADIDVVAQGTVIPCEKNMTCISMSNNIFTFDKTTRQPGEKVQLLIHFKQLPPTKRISDSFIISSISIMD